MFYVKGDDMEEMFKKAADNYELNEELAKDWNSIQTALQNGADTVAAVPVQEKKKRRYLLFWWLLLIPAALLIAYTSGLFKSSSLHTAGIKVNRPVVKTEQEKNIAAKEDSKNITALNQPSSVQIKKLSKQEIINKLNVGKAVIKNNGLQNLEENKKNKLSEDKHTNNSTAENNISGIEINNQSNFQPTTLQAISEQKDENKNEVNADEKIKSSANNSGGNNNLKTSANSVADSVAKNNVAQKTNTSKQKTTKSSTAKQAYFYVGLAGDIDLSFIKYQKLSAPGFGGGLTAGYHFKNRLSIATGVLYDRKNYYTKGKYFDIKNFTYLRTTNSKVINAAGDCNMWEVPLTVNYDFAAHKKINWFISAGISSYFMHEEYYDFTYEKDGTIYQGGYPYFHTKPDWFSVMNVGAGINMHVSNKYSFVIQPYYKVPLSKVGMANLSLTSGGINIFINRRIN